MGSVPYHPEEAAASQAGQGHSVRRTPVSWACPVRQGNGGRDGGSEMLTSEIRSGVDPRHPLPAEGPVTRRLWLTPAYQGLGVERVSGTGDRAGTGLSSPACSASLIHTSSEAPQPTYPRQPPASPKPRRLQAAFLEGVLHPAQFRHQTGRDHGEHLAQPSPHREGDQEGETRLAYSPMQVHTGARARL